MRSRLNASDIGIYLHYSHGNDFSGSYYELKGKNFNAYPWFGISFSDPKIFISFDNEWSSKIVEILFNKYGNSEIDKDNYKIIIDKNEISINLNTKINELNNFSEKEQKKLIEEYFYGSNQYIIKIMDKLE